jgi:hypothetical protein
MKTGLVNLQREYRYALKEPQPKAYVSQNELFLLVKPSSASAQEAGFARLDTEKALIAGYSMDKNQQIRAEWLMTNEAISTWFKSSASRAILINGNSSLERISPLSFFSALLHQSLKALKTVVVLVHFCGLHTLVGNAGDGLYGGLGLLKNLTSQLVAQWRFGELACLSKEFVDTLRRESPRIGLHELWRLFRTLVSALPPGTPLFIFVDGISFYETNDLLEGTRTVTKALTRLVRDRRVEATVKYFVTSANRAMSVGEFFEEDERVWIPENPPGVSLGFADTQFKLAFGKKMARLEDSGMDH